MKNKLAQKLKGTHKRKPLTVAIKREVLERDGFLCQICGSNKKLEIDHIFPASKGGSNEIDNLVTLCGKCNREKSSHVNWWKKHYKGRITQGSLQSKNDKFELDEEHANPPRLPCDTETSYKWFCRYILMGFERSLNKLIEKFGKKKIIILLWADGLLKITG